MEHKSNPMKPGEQRDPTKDENNFMSMMMSMMYQLQRYGESMKDRCAAVPGAWRDLRMLTKVSSKLLTSLNNTFPLRQQMRYSLYAQKAKCVVQIPGPIEDPNMHIVTEKALRVIIGYLLASECSLCMKAGREVQDCELRRALIQVVPPEHYKDLYNFVRDCEYVEMAEHVLLGEEDRKK